MMRIWRTAVDSRAMKRIQAAEYSRRKPGKTKAGGSWGYQRTSMVEAWSRSSQKLSNPQSLWWGQQVCCSLLRGQRQWPEMPSKCFHRIWPARGTLRDMFQLAVVVALGFNTGIVSSATTYGMKGKKGEEEGQRKRRKRFEKERVGAPAIEVQLTPLQLSFLLVPTPPSRKAAGSAVLLPQWVSTGLLADGHEELGDH